MAEIPGVHTYQSVKPYLFSVAYRMTGSASDAEDLIQDAWLRYIAAGLPPVDSLRAYLTTIVSRLALDFLKSARVQREQYVGPWMPEPVLTREIAPGPADSAEQRETVSMAFLMLLEQLSPEQRVVYVLREGFDLAYEDIAAHIDKTAAACRQIFRRARTRLDSERMPAIAPGRDHQRIVERFLAAFETGNTARIAALLASDAVWVGDGGPDRLATRRPVLGSDRIARGLAGFVRKSAPARPLAFDLADINGATGIVVLHEGAVDQVITFDISDGRIATVRSMRNLDKLRHIELALGAKPPALAQDSV